MADPAEAAHRARTRLRKHPSPELAAQVVDTATAPGQFRHRKVWREEFADDPEFLARLETAWDAQVPERGPCSVRCERCGAPPGEVCKVDPPASFHFGRGL